MKKLKKLLSIVFVGIFAFVGAITLSACKDNNNDETPPQEEEVVVPPTPEVPETPENPDETELTLQEKINITTTVLNDAKAKIERASTFEEGNTVVPDENASTDLFTKYGSAVTDNTTEMTTINSNYSSIIDNGIHFTTIIDITLKVVAGEEFSFGTKYETSAVVFEETRDFGVKIFYDANSIKTVFYNDESVNGMNITYNNNSAVCWEFLSEDDYQCFVFSTSNDRAYDYVEHIEFVTMSEGTISPIEVEMMSNNGTTNSSYSIYIYSEINALSYITTTQNMLFLDDETTGEAALVCKNKIDAVNAYINQIIEADEAEENVEE